MEMSDSLKNKEGNGSVAAHRQIVWHYLKRRLEEEVESGNVLTGDQVRAMALREFARRMLK